MVTGPTEDTGHHRTDNTFFAPSGIPSESTLKREEHLKAVTATDTCLIDNPSGTTVVSDESENMGHDAKTAHSDTKIYAVSKCHKSICRKYFHVDRPNGDTV